MTMTLQDLVSMVAKPADQSELLQLGQDLHRGRQARSAAADEVLDKLMERIRWHYRALRAPLPSREDVEKMIADHFK